MSSPILNVQTHRLVHLRSQCVPKYATGASRVLRMLGLRKKTEFLQGMVGREEQVLFENQVENDLRFGLTGQYVRVGVPESETTQNTLEPVRILRAAGEYCLGTVVPAEVGA